MVRILIQVIQDIETFMVEDHVQTMAVVILWLRSKVGV